MINKTIIRTQRNLDISLDVEGSVNVDNTSTLTNYPTALGTGFSDHIYREPTGCNISGKVSTIQCIGSIATFTGDNRVERLVELFNDIRLKGETITILTKAQVLYNQLITNVNVSSSGDSNNTITINLQTSELITTKIRTTTINIEKPKVEEGADKVMTDKVASQGKEEVVTDGKTSTAEVVGAVAGGALLGAGVVAGASKVGALLGTSVLPGIGTGVGALIGGGIGIIGCIAESIIRNRNEEE